MLLLTSTSDKLRLVTSSTADIHVHASYVDYASGTITPGSAAAAITTATTTDIVAVPGVSTQRNVKNLTIRNKHASTSNDVTLQFYNGTAYELFKCTLAAGEQLVFNDGFGFEVFSATGALKTTSVNTTQIGVRVYNSIDLTIPNDTTTVLTFDSERFDTNAHHSTSSNTSRLTCVVAGLHDIKANARFAFNATGYRAIQIFLNGTTLIANVVGTPATVDTTFAIATVWDMAVGDYVEIRVHQNSGGNLAVAAASAYSPEASMVRLG